MFRSVGPVINSVLRSQNVGARVFSSQIEAKIQPELIQDAEWEAAMPYSKIPGPSKVGFLRGFLPGGKYYKKTLLDLMTGMVSEYGNIFKMPGMFGRLDIIITLDPDNFQKVFRTEGIWPIRRGNDTFDHYRTIIRPDIFGSDTGLLSSQGKSWGDFRTTVNQVMMQPKIAKLYIPHIDEVAVDFIKRIRDIRDPSIFVAPDNFDEELHRWAFESIGTIALDTRLGLIGDLKNENVQEIRKSLILIFDLAYKLEILPSIWKIIPTPGFKKLMNALDKLTNITIGYVNEAKLRIEKRQADGIVSSDHEQSVLEKLLKINPRIAIVMALDMLFAGVDTTTSALTFLLYLLAKNPDKQEILRQELIKILPEKDTSLTAEKMNNLPYLRACVKESMRIHPIINGNFRATGQDIVLSGYQVPKGTNVAMSSILLQSQDQIFPQALQFQPERWLKDQSSGCPASAKTAHPFIYLPFGFGKRMCIGRRFAEMEIEIITARIIRNFNIDWKNPDLKFKSTTINFPDGKLKFTFNDINK